MIPDRAAELEQLKRAVLLKRLQQTAVAKPTAARPALHRVARDTPLPLSFAQQRLWFLDQLDAEASVAYQLRAALRLRGALDENALRRALDTIVARHEILRTRFEEAHGVPVQVIEPATRGFELGREDLTALPPDVREATLATVIEHECRRGFDLRGGVLVRGRLIRLDAQEWVLWIAQHHIVSDAWSIGVLIAELRHLYNAAVDGLDSGLPLLGVQYADYASWQRKCLRSGAMQQHVEFWQQHLAGAPALLELPSDRPRRNERRFAGALVPVDLGPELSNALRALAKRHGATLFMALFASWALVLSRLSGQDDVVVGTPVANRPRRELEGLLGFFVNTLALRLRFLPTDTTTSVLARLRELTLAAYSHAELPFDHVVEVLQPTRSNSHSPLFQSMFALDSTAASELSLSGMETTLLTLPYRSTHYDLTLSLNDAGQAVTGSLGYSVELFDRATVERFLDAWLHLLAGMVASPECRIARLPMLSAAQRALVLGYARPCGEPVLSSTATVLAAFAARAWAQPDVVAVECRGQRWRYGDVEAASNALAARLRAHGVGAEDIVGLCVERSPQMVVGVLGILKAGAAYLPLDPAYPRERLSHMIADSGMRLLLGEAATASVCAMTTRPILLIDAGDGEPRASEPSALVHADQAAYVIYTSGSTGLPKGVVVTHGGLSNVIAAYRETFPLTPGQRVLHFVSLSFDAATAHLFLALCSGATLCIHDRHAADMRDLAEVLRSEGIHYVGLPVSVLASLCAADLPELQYLSTGTEACPIQLVERWGRDRRFVNIYGPTEASICSTMSVFDPGRDCSALARPPIGRPISQTRIYVLDPELQPVPIGVIGELFIAGRGVARGYVGQPGLSAERFLPDPLGDEPGARMYRTGDLVRMLANGEIDFIGRRDAQVKLRGFRIELGEVESALRAFPGVQAAAATLIDAGSENARLVGYVVAPLDVVNALPEFLRSRLPAHLLPASILRIEQLPLSANGKLDRAALPRPVASDSASTWRAPEGETASQLAVLWSELLRRESVSADADFFESGGHSLLATQLIARVNRQFGVSLPLKLVFDAPVLERMAERIDSARAASTARMSVLADITAATDPAAAQPLSFAQQRLWFLEQMSPGDASYHIPGALRLHGVLDVAALRRAFAALLSRHAILRTRIVDRDGTPVQIAEPVVELAFDVVNVGAAAWPQQLARFARLSFDFAIAPLLRAELVRCSDREHVLLVTLHHIVSDGWSLGVLMRELSALYRAEVEGVAPSLPPLPLQYADFARWQRQWLAAGELDRQLDYWRERLRALPPLLELPTDRPRPRERTGQGALAQFTLSAEMVADLRALCAREGVTLFMVLLAAFKILLARLTGESDIFVGTLVANRTRVELEPLIGFFVNTLVLRDQVDLTQDFRSFLQQVRSTTLDAYAHQDVPFEQLVETLRPSRSLAYTPLFQVLCSMQNTPAAELVLPGLEVEIVASNLGIAKFDLALDFKEVGDLVLGEVEYASDLFAADTISAWIDGLRHLLAGIVRNAAAAMHHLPLCDPAAAHRFQEALQGELRPLPALRSVPAQIIAQAARCPDAIAYVAGGRSLSYGELDRRSSQLARALRDHGMPAEAVVGVCLPRGPELAIAILAVWKAGGVYLPMDPDYPASRLGFMLRDADVSLVLASGVEVDEELWHGVVVLDPAADGVAQQSDLPLSTTWHPSSLAYLIYTSGSTGTPKGVQVDHRALAQHCHGVQSAYGLRADDRVLHFAALGFDISLDQLLPTWVAGATVVARDPELWSPRELAEKLVDLDISVADLPSALWHLVAKEWSVDSDTPMHPRLRLFLVGGEAMASESLRHWRQTPYAKVPLLNGYGPTETTITSSGHWCTADTATTTVPIGRPFANRRFYVLDEQLRMLPPGFPGELFIAGEGLARCYRKQPGMTAAVFLPDPHHESVAGARMYRSGDRVRFRADGQLEFLGRVDGQVKLQGFRIELEEVESALRALPQVRDAAAAVHLLANGDRRLIGYLLLEAGSTLDATALRLQLARELPEHFVPSILMNVDRLPLMNGKIHRKALPVPEPVEDEGLLAPRNDTEAWLAALWAELLGLREVGVESDFFMLGGHSLLATQVLARVRRQYGIQIPVRQLFDAPTIAEMAAHIDALMAIRQGGGISPVDANLPREEIEL